MAAAASVDPRERVVGLLERSLDAAKAKEVEVGVFNWSLKHASERGVPKNWRNRTFRSIYSAKARSVMANLDPESYVENVNFLARLAGGEFRAVDVAAMDPAHVFPDRWRHVLDLKLQRDEYISNAKPSAMTDQFKCARCKNRQTTYVEAQLRSADEPATLFIQCCVCGLRWRMG